MSVSTVSRVFNGYDDVSPATRERVLDVARRLDYAPSAAARTLVKQRSQLIGVVLKERLSRLQVVGMIGALVAVVLIVQGG